MQLHGVFLPFLVLSLSSLGAGPTRPDFSPCPGTSVCPDCPTAVSAQVAFGQTLSYTGFDADGVDYEAVLTLVDGEATLSVEGADNVNCGAEVCTFTGNGDALELMVTGSPGPATFFLDAYPLD